MIMFAFVVNEWMLYIGGVIAFLDATSTTMFRSMISKNVHPNEVGKVFSIVGIFQALIPFVASPVFRVLYRNTVKTTPEAFIYLIIALKVAIFFDILYVHICMVKNDKKMKAVEAQEGAELKEDFLNKDKKESTVA